VLGKLARQHDPNVLVGFDKADDAGVYRLSPELALVQTVDFFTPIVDDPYTFGQIAAVNSLSDVYAMGGRPLNALTMVCFPEKGDLDVLERILAGGLSKMMEANCTIVGGHSVRDDEIKFGYAVTGTIHPDRVLANSGARPGDRLILTKAIGTGVISTAIKKQQAEQAWIDAAIASMTRLNKIGGEKAAATAGVHAMTDITGFGMVGHAREMALASNVSIAIYANRIPLLPGALQCVHAGHIPGGLKANREFAECAVDYAAEIPEDVRTILFDPQTAGGLLISVAAKNAPNLVAELIAAGEPAVEIGEVRTAVRPLIDIVS
jgi:selenide,water dikinase